MNNGLTTLTYATTTGLKSLNLDELTADNLNANAIDGDFFSINTIKANDVQVDNELELTQNGFITIGKGLPGEITVTDTEVGHLDGVTSNIQNQIDSIDSNVGSFENKVARHELDIGINTSNVNTLSTNVYIDSLNISNHLIKYNELLARIIILEADVALLKTQII